MPGYDDWKSREPDPWEFDDKPEQPQMRDREPTSRKLLRQIQRAAGLDPDGPRLVPMTPHQVRQQTRQALRHASEAATRDAMLRRAIRFA